MSQNTDPRSDSEVINTERDLKDVTEHLTKKFDLNLEVEIEIADQFKRKAGQYRYSEKKIRISRYLLENHPEKVVKTVKHELGHAVVMGRHGKRRTEPHGEEWKSVMKELGVEDPEACHSLQLTGYDYIVRCTDDECDFELGRYRESRLVKKPQLYICNECGSSLESFEVREKD